MLLENPTDLIVNRKSSPARGAQTAINSGKLCWRCVIFSSSELGVDFELDLRELILSLLGPRLYALQNVLENLR